MSKYMFIASDKPLPNVDYSNSKSITVREAKKIGLPNPNNISWDDLNPNDKILYFEKADDLGEVIVIKTTHKFKDINYYTNKKYIYDLGFVYSDKRADDIIRYIKNNICQNEEIEIWSTWLDHINQIKKNSISLNDLNQEHIKNLYEEIYYNISIS